MTIGGCAAAILVLATTTGTCAAASQTPAHQAVASSASCQTLEKESPSSGRNASAKAQAVGDCWIRAGKTDRAIAFYHRLKQAGTKACDSEGTACDVLASEELRRIDCGGAWLARSPEQAWRGFIAALGDQANNTRDSHARPDVRAWSDRNAMLSESCPTDTYALPKTLRDRRQQVTDRVMGESRSWETIMVRVPLSAEDLPWKNYSADLYRFLGVRVCRAVRPVAGAPAGGYYIQLAPLEAADATVTCEGR